jgi:D-sedoheptulose 7-phosphate isomerase
MQIDYDKIFNDHHDAVEIVRQQTGLIYEIANTISKSFKAGGKVLIMGNGGSAGDSQHFAAELVGRFVTERRGLPGIALTTDSSILTAIANDYSYENVFVRQVAALAKNSDVVIGITTSGRSKNIVRALKEAKELGCTTIGLTGNVADLESVCNILVSVPDLPTARVQEAHILIIHIICEHLDLIYTTSN